MKPGKTLFTILVIYLFSGIISLSGQLQQFDHFAVEDGISQSAIICIFQDSEGFIWIGTQNGLNKFDGYTFENYFNDPGDTNSISNSWIFDITEDKNGCLWIGTKGGLNRFNKETGLFSRVDLSYVDSRINNSFVYGLTSDESGIYINQSPFLTVLNYQTGSIDYFENDFEPDEALYDLGFPIIKDNNGVLWIGSIEGLASFNPEEKKFRNYLFSESDPNTISQGRVTALAEDHQNNILVGTVNGFNILNPETGGITRYLQDPNDESGLSNNHITSLVQDYSGAIWLGTSGGGLNKMIPDLRAGTADYIHFESGPENAGYINHDIVLSLCEDYSRNLWIGSLAGIDKSDLKKKNIRTYVKSDNPNSIDLLDNIIASVYQDKEDRIWIGTWGKGLTVLDRNTGEVVNYTAGLPGQRHIPENHVHVLFEDSRSNIWIGTRNGVSIYENSTGRFIPAGDYLSIPGFGFFNNNRVYCMIERSGGDVWIGTGSGIFILNTQTKTSRVIRATGDSLLSLNSNLVYSLLEDRDGDVWIATSGGLNRYDLSEGRMYRYLNDPNSSNCICDNYTISLCEDLEGNIWIGTSTGISNFNKGDSLFTCYNTSHGLPSNIIYDIMKDAKGNLWFSTGGGLAMKNPDDGAKETFIIIDELQGKEFNIKAVFRNDDGEMFFGGIEGMVSFYPDSLKDNTYIPPVKITSFEKETGGIRQKMNVYNEEMILSYRDYSFTIEFSALEFTNPLKNRYSYQMKGISDRWVDIGNRRFVHFTNLSPGKYTFRVKGSNNDGVWNTKGASMRITILPPWWRSNYAYVSYIFLVILVIIVVIKMRERNLIREKKVLEQKITERTVEIAQQKDELEELNATKDRFFSILAHDLKNPFSSLYSMSELAIENYQSLEEDEKLKMLQNIHKSAELIYNLLENLLTWSKSQRGRIDYSPERFNLSKIIEVSMNLHQIPAEKKGVILSANVEDELLCFGDREMINTVVRNLVNNAVKFSKKSDTVKVGVKQKGKTYEVSVRDEGIGISEENTKKLFRIDKKYKTEGTAGETGTGLGLVLCKEFVEKNGGEIHVSSKEGSGTEFAFTIQKYNSGSDDASNSSPE